MSLRVYDISGRTVANLREGMTAAGYHNAVWNAEGVAAGIYFCRIKSGGQEAAVKLVLAK